MARNFSADDIADLAASVSSRVLLFFVIIEHETLYEPIRLVCDAIGARYNYRSAGDELFFGALFDFQIPSDSDAPPTGQFVVQNVDRRIGEAILDITTPPRFTMFSLNGDDFDGAKHDSGEVDENGQPIYVQYAVGSPTVRYEARFLKLINIRGDVMQFSADIASYDITDEPWPASRTTKDRAPGLYA